MMCHSLAQDWTHTGQWVIGVGLLIAVWYAFVDGCNRFGR